MQQRTKKAFAWVMTFAMLLSLLPAAGLTALAAGDPVSYCYPVYNKTTGTPYEQASSGIAEWKDDGSVTNYTEVTSSIKTWSNGWYVVKGTNVIISGTVTVSGDVHLILTDGSKLTVTSLASAENEDNINAAIRVPSGNSLTIYGQTGNSGELTAKCEANGEDYYVYGAAIGGNNLSWTEGENSGAITINGGKITAIGHWSGAGIGGGCYGTGSDITINGGTVNATGGVNGAAGIGGGSSDNGSDITINGGTVNAMGGKFGAGIGGGCYGTSSDITINGGTVNATGGVNGAGIGGGGGSGEDGNGSGITITGGTVNATGGENGAGIGGGLDGAGSSITITGGTVTANGGNADEYVASCGAGIGNGGTSGEYSVPDASNITIATSLTVKADENNPPTTVIGANRSSTTDLATLLAGKQYATVTTLYSLTGVSSPQGTGGVTFTVGGSTATTAAAGAAVKATATPVAGYTATLSAVDADGGTVTIAADGTFTMPGKAVTVTATYTKQLTVSGTTVADKTYDGTIDATATVGTVTGIAEGDQGNVTVTATATFTDANAGTNKDVTVTYALSGTAASKYIAPEDDSRLTATISPRQLTVIDTRANGKTYDGNTDAVVGILGTLNNPVEGDEVSIATATATFADKDVGNSKDVTITYTLGGGDAENYTVSSSTTTADIDPKSIKVKAEDKNSYVGSALVALTYIADALCGDDKFSGTLETNANKDVVGNDYTITQGTLTAGSNYNITFTGATYTVKKLESQMLTFADGDQTKTYGDAAFTKTVTGASTTVTYESSDPTVATVNPTTGEVTILKAGTATITAKAAKTATYDAAEVSYKLTVNKAKVTVDGIEADGKTYDGNTSATLTYLNLNIGGTVNSETLTATATGTFENENVGNGKNVIISNITLKDKPNQDYLKNYELATSGNQTSTKADITKFTDNTISDLSCADIRVGGTPAPTAKATFGDITYTYSKDGETWDTWENVNAGTGTYQVKAEVADTANYNGCSESATFRVTSSGGGSSGGGGGSSVSTYPVSVTSPVNGTAKADKTSASKGSTVTVTVTPNEGYTVDTVTVKDASGNTIETTKTSDTTYTFTMPNSKVTVSATFQAEKEETPAPAVDSNPFTDVKESDYFYEPVLWAVDKGITSGVTATTFCPYDITTRAQMVTFLWRAAGSPEPTTTVNPFVDVKEGDYFYKAVLWGYENVYVKGTSDTTFSPNLTVTRGQAVTFLARMAGVADEATGYTHSFTDVSADAYYNNSIAWASQKGIANGTGENTFAPDQGCKRGEVVTFLYRNYNN